MQLANVMVKLGGDNNNIVPKSNVTPAEIMVLRHIHGHDCVVDIRPCGEDKKKHDRKEYDRLASIYDVGGGAFMGEAGEERKSVLAALFPGAMPKLPKTLEEIGETTFAPEPVIVPDLPETDTDEGAEAEAVDGDDDTIAVDAIADGEGENANTDEA